MSVLGPDADESLRQVLRDVDQPVARKAEVLLSRMTDGMFVMAIDQLEDLFTPADVIADAQWRDFLEVLLQASHGVRVLTSSRRRMVVSPTAMRGVRLVPIDHGLPEADAVQVLRELDHEGTLGLRNAPESQLRWGVQRVHGMPRALGAIASILANDQTLTFDRLVGDNLVFEGEVLENLVAEQYRRLTSEQRLVVEALSVFGHPIPEVAVRIYSLRFTPRSMCA